MANSKKINDFRALSLKTETTPTKKNVGAVSVSKKKNKDTSSVKSNNITKKQAKAVQEMELYEEDDEKKKPGVGIALFFLILVFIGAFVGCMFTPVFNVTTINIQEGTYIDSNDIKSKFDGVNGENIFRVNIKSIKKSIKDMAYIKDVDIKRNLPDTINVTFEEREPFAIIKYLESFVVMDKYGYVLEIKKENDLPDLAIIYGINANEYVIGEKLEDVAGLKYENISYLLETANKNDFDYIIYEINYTDSEKLVMAVKDLDVDINFGEIDRNILTEKMSYLNGILKKLNGKKGNLDISSNNYLEKTIFTERY